MKKQDEENKNGFEKQVSLNQSKKKVLFVANVVKEHILKFHVPTIELLKNKGWHVDVAAAGEEEVPFCDHQFKLSHKRNPFHPGTVLSVLQMRRILKKGKYDILSCHTPTGGIVARIASIGLKKRPYVIYTAHGFHFYKGAPAINWLLYFPVEWILSYLTDELVLINKEDYENAKRLKFGMKKVTLLHGMGVDSIRFEKASTMESKSRLREELRIPNDEFVFTYVAEIIKNKNQVILVDALRKLRKKTNNGMLVLVGPIHDEGKLQSYVKDSGMDKYVIFTGWRNDIPELLSITDACTASSIREGLGLNLIEAQMAGIPVIASDNRGHRDIIECGVNGLLIKGNDAKEFANAMYRIMKDNDLRESFIMRGKESAKNYSLDRSLSELLSIYRNAND